MMTELDTTILSRNALSIFDMDGTIIDSMSLWRGVNYRYLDHKGIKYDIVEVSNLISNSASFSVVYELFSTKYLPHMSGTEIYNDLILMLAKEYDKIKIDRHALSYIKALKAKGHKVALGTANDRRLVEIILKNNKIEDLFDAVVTASDVTDDRVGHNKNIIYMECIKRCNSAMSLTTIFEDSEYALKYAADKGFAGLVLVNTNKFDTSNINYSCKIIDSFNELTSNIDAHVCLTRHAQSFKHMAETYNSFVLSNINKSCMFIPCKIGDDVIVPMRMINNHEIYLLPGSFAVVKDNKLHSKIFDIVENDGLSFIELMDMMNDLQLVVF